MPPAAARIPPADGTIAMTVRDYEDVQLSEQADRE